ncbi:MAG: hypothetical protein ACRENL_11430 [Candidatus Dormibacteria bacterium]
MTSPYITPAMLRNRPYGIAWSSLGDQGSSADEDAVITALCWQASSEADSFCSQDLRATLNTEQEEGPDFRITIRPNGNVRMILSRFPVLSVVSLTVQLASDFVGSSLVPVPANQVRILSPLLGEDGTAAPGAAGAYPYAIEFAGGWVDWLAGRGGYLVTCGYINGWPHAGLTANAAAGAGVLAVDECTGMVGTSPYVGDGLLAEQVKIQSASATTGPGTLILAGTLANGHNAGELCTTLPAVGQEGVMNFAAGMALQRGAMSLTAQGQPSKSTNTAERMALFKDEAELLLGTFRRVI